MYTDRFHVTSLSTKIHNKSATKVFIFIRHRGSKFMSELKILFDAEPAGSTRFSPLAASGRRKWVRSFCPDIKKI